jgi:hypothetical protein
MGMVIECLDVLVSAWLSGLREPFLLHKWLLPTISASAMLSELHTYLLLPTPSGPNQSMKQSINQPIGPWTEYPLKVPHSCHAFMKVPRNNAPLFDHNEMAFAKSSQILSTISCLLVKSIFCEEAHATPIWMTFYILVEILNH